VTTAWWGALLGGLAATGAWVAVHRVAAVRRGAFAARVLYPLRDMPELGRPNVDVTAGPLRQLFGPMVQAAAQRLEGILGGTASVRRRLERAALEISVHDFRVQQIVWGTAALAISAAVTILVVSRSPERLAPMLILTAVAGALGVMYRENRLTAQVRAHETRVVAELPAVAELLALAVAAGESPVAALERVVARSRGALSGELGRVLGAIRTGTPVAQAFDDYSARTGLPVVSRFASGLAVAVERGTPLADVLHAQAADVREFQRRSLIESGARREVAMMVPVVFLVLPTTVLFAFWPGVVGLRMVAP
jgi:tight adherence protein C